MAERGVSLTTLETNGFKVQVVKLDSPDEAFELINHEAMHYLIAQPGVGYMIRVTVPPVRLERDLIIELLIDGRNVGYIHQCSLDEQHDCVHVFRGWPRDTHYSTYYSFEFAAATASSRKTNVSGPVTTSEADEIGKIEIKIWKAIKKDIIRDKPLDDYVAEPLSTAAVSSAGDKKWFNQASLSSVVQKNRVLRAPPALSRRVYEKDLDTPPLTLSIKCERKEVLILRGIIEKPPPRVGKLIDVSDDPTSSGGGGGVKRSVVIDLTGSDDEDSAPSRDSDRTLPIKKEVKKEG